MGNETPCRQLVTAQSPQKAEVRGWLRAFDFIGALYRLARGRGRASGHEARSDCTQHQGLAQYASYDNDKRASFKSLGDPWADTTTPHGKLKRRSSLNDQNEMCTKGRIHWGCYVRSCPASICGRASEQLWGNTRHSISDPLSSSNDDQRSVLWAAVRIPYRREDCGLVL
jgi:hypothetical protein